MDGSRPSLSLVLPAFDEQAVLRQAIVEADEALANLFETYEILVVDDGSTDLTAAIAADEATRRDHVRLLRHPRNRGYGAALRTGFEAARFHLVAFTDADCQFHLEDLGNLVALTARAPIVVGRRIDRKDSARRCFLSRGYNFLVRTLLGTQVRDVDCALKVFRRDALAQILPQSRGFFVNTEMLTQASQLGLDVLEVPVRHRPRLGGQSSVSLREVPRTLAHLLPFWWSRVLFPGRLEHTRTPAPSADPTASWWPVLLVLLVACALFFSRMRAPLLEPQEARYAEIPRQMLAEGRLLVPVLHGESYLDKPPLLYWSVMASYQLFGIHDTSARVVPGLAGVLVVLATYFWGRRVLGPRPGLCAASILALTPEFVYRGRMLGFDTLLTLWVVLALALAHVALLGPRLQPVWWLLSASACGLGLLTKGPVALALVVVPVLILSLLDPRLVRPGWRGWLGFVGLALLIAAPWYVAVLLREPGFAGSFFWKHNVVRFLAPFDHHKPIWFYLPGLLLGLFVWLLLLPGLLRLLRQRNGQDRPAALGFALVSFLWMVVFFSLAGCKRPSYLLPALPPLALVLGWYIHVRTPECLWSHGSRLATATCGLGVAGMTVLALLACSLGVVRPPVGLALAGSWVALVAVLVGLGRRLSWSVTGGVIFAGLFLGVQLLLPAYNDLFSLRGQLRRLASVAERDGRPIVCYPQRYDSASFYLPRGRVRVFGLDQRRQLLAHLDENPGTLLLVKSGPVMQGLLARLPPGVEFRAHSRRGAIIAGRVVARHEPAQSQYASMESRSRR